MDQVISLEIKERVGYIIINRPKANCYEINFHKQLLSCIEEAIQDDNIKAIVLKSALDKFFCAGADVKVFQQNSVDENKLMVEYAKKVANLLHTSKKITIASIAGHALGGGLELAMACDIRLASEGNYFLGLPEIKLGLMPGNGGSQYLIRLIGAGKALELLISGDNLSPAKAFELGLVNHLLKQNTFEEEVHAFAKKIADGPLEAIAAVKQSVQKGIELSLEEGLQLESKLVDTLYDTDDAREGSLAFVEKRNPNFK
ncbi:enoyl-CoA hydratase/isomerase family protein [Saccharicrinis aurantiacus]|uniref:enoyl-CoA hydratase/isomerase family protein n=1 Tax=Saccharicrinis aurantiacus TaxID=1849719 RepID=UPI0009501B6D|nr:enoyl-CoA hydratase-related protein [Saccharicrinis aurantiacus]